MSRFLTTFLGAVLAAAAMLAGTQSASALSISVTSGTPIATTTGLTLRDPALGAIISNLTLNLSITRGTYPVNGSTHTIGQVTSGTGVVTSVPGMTFAVIAPWTITTVGTLTASGVEVRMTGLFTLTHLFGPLRYNCSIEALLNAAGSRLTVTSSSCARTGLNTTFAGSPVFAVSPSIAWTTIP
jgi:hypothetical protein